MPRKINFQDEVQYKSDNKTKEGKRAGNDDDSLNYLPKTSGTYYYHKHSGRFAPAGDVMKVGIEQKNKGHQPTDYPHVPQPQSQLSLYRIQSQQPYYPPQPQPCGNYGNPNPCGNPYVHPCANPYGTGCGSPYANHPPYPYSNPYFNPHCMMGGMSSCYPPQPQPQAQPIKSVCEGVLPMVIPSCNQYAGIPTPFPIPISLPGPAGAYPFQTEPNQVSSDRKQHEKSETDSSPRNRKSKKKKDKKGEKEGKKKKKSKKSKSADDDKSSEGTPPKHKPDPSDTSVSYSTKPNPESPSSARTGRTDSYTTETELAKLPSSRQTTGSEMSKNGNKNIPSKQKKNLNVRLATINTDPLPNIMHTSGNAKPNRHWIQESQSELNPKTSESKIHRRRSLARLHEEHFPLSTGLKSKKLVHQGDNTDPCISDEETEHWTNLPCKSSFNSSSCLGKSKTQRQHHQHCRNRPSSRDSYNSNHSRQKQHHRKSGNSPKPKCTKR